ncbi:MAG: efflux RND transporter periplasmic adaptor subunit [Bacteroidaceae bacterium]
MNMKTILCYMSVLLPIICSCGRTQEPSADREAVVHIDTVKAPASVLELQYPGHVVASTEANVSFKVAGMLKRVLVSEGDLVKAGQLLAEIDPVDYEVQLNATEAEYAQIKADAERVIGLYQDGGTTASNYDKARYGLKQIEAKLQNHRNQLGYTRLTAPFSGRIQKCYFSGGENVSAGLPIMKMLSDSALEVEVNLPAVSYLDRDGFSGFSCTFDILPGVRVPLSLIGILPQANANQLYTMRLALPKQDGRVAPGMSSWVSISMSDSINVGMSVPSTALIEIDGKSYVFAYDQSSSKVRRVPVDVRMLHTDGTAEVEGNLMIGNLVVSSGVHHLQDGQQVRMLAPVSKTNIGGLL